MLKTIDVLVEAGADVEARDKYRQTPLHIAADRSHHGAVLSLLRYGADVCAETGSLGHTPLHSAASRAEREGTVQVMKDLLQQGAEVNAKCSQGKTPLHMAAAQAGKHGIAQVVDVLLRWGADEAIVNKSGLTPADAIGKDVAAQERLTSDVEHVRKLLATAPADRAWRRRGYLTMCRAHTDKLLLKPARRATDADVMPRTRSRARVARIEENSTCGPSGGSITTGGAGGEWVEVVVKVLRFEEEGIFRTIVGYL